MDYYTPDNGMPLKQAFEIVLNMASRTATGDAHEIKAMSLILALAVGTYGMSWEVKT